MSFNSSISHLLRPSMELIKHDAKIKIFYFIPGIFSVIILSLILLYQSLYTYVELLGNSERFLTLILDFFQSYSMEVIITMCIIVLFYIIVSPILEATLIRYIDMKSNGEESSRSDAFGFGIVRFATMFEYNNIFNMFRFISIINGYLFALRFLGIEYLYSLSIFFIIAFLFSIILNVLTAYTRYEIVLEKKGVFEAIGISSQIALLNMKMTLKLYILMFIMNIKVLLNFIIFLIFPILVIFILGFITSQIFSFIVIFVLGVIFLFLLSLLGYMAGVLEIFTTSIWYEAYKEGRKKLEKNKI